jgi:hypothetical protein
MDIVDWTHKDLKIVDCAILPSPMGGNAHTLYAQGTVEEEPVIVSFPPSMRTFSLPEAVALICYTAAKLKRRDLAQTMLCHLFGENIGKRALMDSGYFKRLEAAL